MDWHDAPVYATTNAGCNASQSVQGGLEVGHTVPSEIKTGTVMGSLRQTLSSYSISLHKPALPSQYAYILCNYNPRCNYMVVLHVCAIQTT